MVSNGSRLCQSVVNIIGITNLMETKLFSYASLETNSFYNQLNMTSSEKKQLIPASRSSLHSRNHVTQSLRQSTWLNPWLGMGKSINSHHTPDLLSLTTVPSPLCPCSSHKLTLLSSAIQEMICAYYKVQFFLFLERCGTAVCCHFWVQTSLN